MAKILAIDDSVSICDLMKSLLTQHGHQVTTAKNGREALDIARKEQFDLVFTDLNMPEMNGTSLVMKLRKLSGYEYTPIVIVTTENAQYKKNKARATGASGWLEKPITEERLINALSRLLA